MWAVEDTLTFRCQAVQFMSNEKAVLDAATQAAEIAEQVFTEDRPSETGEKLEQAENTQSDAEQAPADPKQTGEEEASATSDVSGETTTDGQQKAVKLGNREFATVDEAIKEAERVVGHNANLASEVTTFKTKFQDTQTKLEEALKANQEWAEWAEAQKSGEKTELPNQPKLEDVVRKVLAEREAHDHIKTLEVKLKSEVDQLQTLSNFNQALPILQKLADQVNPSTGSKFTPFEAYKYACWELGLKNELVKSDTKPVSPASSEAAKSAVRPTGNGTKAATKTEPPKDEVDEILSQYF
jgi:hypothetical protein